MDAVNPWWSLDGCCCKVVHPRSFRIERCYHQALIHARVAPETVNLKIFPGPRLRLPPALEEGEWGGGGGSEGGWGGGFGPGGGGVLLPFFLFYCLSGARTAAKIL